MKSLCINIGCSFTTTDYYEKVYGHTPEEHVYWGQIVANQLGLKHMNYAKSGAGSDRHLYDLTRAIADHGTDIELILIGWSSWDRFSYPYAPGVVSVCPPTAYKEEEYDHDYEMFIMSRKKEPKRLYQSAIHQAYTNMYACVQLAKTVNAKLVMFQMLKPTNIIHTWLGQTLEKKRWGSFLSRERQTALWEVIANSSSYDRLEEEESLMGFPFLHELGGYPLWDLLHEYYKRTDLAINKPLEKAKYFINRDVVEVHKHAGMDFHPAAFGHAKIAEKVLEHYEKVYK